MSAPFISFYKVVNGVTAEDLEETLNKHDKDGWRLSYMFDDIRTYGRLVVVLERK